MPKFVVSTLTASQKYPIYTKIPGRDLPNMESYVFIYGGANLPTKVLVTPAGAVTPLTDEEYDRVKETPGFKLHRENGFLTVLDSEPNVDEVAADLEEKDTSAPMVPKDFEDAGTKPPTSASPNSDDADNSSVRSTQRPAQAKAKKADAKPKRARRGRPRKEKTADA